ncbi:MAG: Gfo/Idh/MocA family oxidoreductase [Methylobacteriaceae bacterium]|nr:Gfo/Idh/MocA family oxidoreductase [Methylobacteriaceae bacterium]MBV9247167.1 Gfo/Idh/MocA family oxidoreductase [Methylobacteriaceae bacterium]
MPRADTKGERLKVGVIGAGIGKAHVAAYRQLPECYHVEAICDLDAEKARTVATEHEVAKVMPDYDALLGLDLDVIDICTPSNLHFTQALQALDAGRHVVLEKPVARSLAEVDRLEAAELASGRHLMPIFQYRFGNGLGRLRHLEARGLVGKPYMATVETHWRRRPAYYEAGPWRGRWESELGGCLLTHAIHSHDLLMQVFGPVRSIAARVATRVNTIETEDCAAAVLEMASGALATLSVTLGSEQQISRLRFCFDGLAVESSHEPYAPASDPWRFIAGDESAQARINAALGEFVPHPEAFVGQLAQFHAALTRSAAVPVTLADARASLELVTAAYHSARTGTPARLPISPDHPFYQGWQPARASDM